MHPLCLCHNCAQFTTFTHRFPLNYPHGRQSRFFFPELLLPPNPSIVYINPFPTFIHL